MSREYGTNMALIAVRSYMTKASKGGSVWPSMEVSGESKTSWIPAYRSRVAKISPIIHGCFNIVPNLSCYSPGESACFSSRSTAVHEVRLRLSWPIK
jgi:hypothetical protein